MSIYKNTVATPLATKAFKLHNYVFNRIYQCPLHVKIENGQASIRIENILNIKYIPFVLVFLLVTAIVFPGSCLFLLLLKFWTATDFGAVELVVFIFIGSCTVYQVATVILYCSSTEIEALTNKMFSLERNYYNSKPTKSVDWLGLFYVFFHITLILICILLPVVAVCGKLDPVYYVIEMILPPSNKRSSPVVALTILARLFIIAICTFEYSRFITLHLFIFLSMIFTISTCLRKVIRNFIMPETITFKLYTNLRVVLKSLDCFIRQVFVLTLVFYQLLLVSLWWLVLKCWNILPIYMTLVFGMVATTTLIALIIVIPRTVEISNASNKFIEHKKAMNHTFKRSSRKNYYFWKWSAQRMLPMRFGTHFVMSVKTPINYLNVLVVNLMNAILLINP